jgi:hypothetical protein
VCHASLRAMASEDAAAMSGAHAMEVYKNAMVEQAGLCLGRHTHQPSNKSMKNMSRDEKKAMVEQAGLCLGRHTHQPSNKSMKNMSREECAMRSFHEAAADGCLPCVIEWVTKGLDVTQESYNGHFTAMSWIEHELIQNWRDANQVKRLNICKNYLANLNAP